MPATSIRLALGASALGLALVLSPSASAGGKPAKPPAGKPPPAAPAKEPASVSEITKAFDAMEMNARVDVIRKRIEALEAYAKAHPDAKDVGEAKEGVAGARQALVQVASGAEDYATAVRFADEYLAAHPDGDGKVSVLVSKARAQEELDDYAGAKATWESIKPHVSGQDLEYVTTAIKRAEMVGQDPLPFPEGAKDMDDKPLSLADYKGKVLLVDFWATWCGPCVQEMPHVVAAYDKFHDQGFDVVGISLDREDAADSIHEFEKEKGMKWRQFYDGQFWKNEIAVLYEVHGIPHTILIGRDGKVAAFGLRGEKLMAKVEKLLAAK